MFVPIISHSCFSCQADGRVECRVLDTKNRATMCLVAPSLSIYISLSYAKREAPGFPGYKQRAMSHSGIAQNTIRDESFSQSRDVPCLSLGHALETLGYGRNLPNQKYCRIWLSPPNRYNEPSVYLGDPSLGVRYVAMGIQMKGYK